MPWRTLLRLAGLGSSFLFVLFSCVVLWSVMCLSDGCLAGLCMCFGVYVYIIFDDFGLSGYLFDSLAISFLFCCDECAVFNYT